MPLLQEESESEEESLQTHHPSWELRDRLFLACLLPEPDQVDLRATATTSQRLVEGARRSAEAQAVTTPLLACYKTPKKEKVSHVFRHLITNIKSYNKERI